MVSKIERGTEHDRGVHVMAAGMRHTRNLAAIRHVLVVIHGECIEVRAQGHGWLIARDWVVRSEFADEAGSDGEDSRLHPCQFKAFAHQFRGGMFRTAHLGVRMHVAAHGDEFLAVFGEPAGQSGVRRRHAWSKQSSYNSSARWCTTSASVAPASTRRRCRIEPEP